MFGYVERFFIFLNLNLYVLLLDLVFKVKYFQSDLRGTGEEIIVMYINRYFVLGEVK